MNHRDIKTKRIEVVKSSGSEESLQEHNKIKYEQNVSGKNEIARVRKALTLLKEISSQRCDKASFSAIETMQTIMDKLEERTVQSQLPLAAIHKTLHEVRLEALLLSTQIKVQAMYDHQILIAPRAEWREQIKSNHPELNEWYDLKKETPQVINKKLQNQLNILVQASDILFNFNNGTQ